MQEQPQILHFVQDDSALGRGMFPRSALCVGGCELGHSSDFRFASGKAKPLCGSRVRRVGRGSKRGCVGV